MKHDIYGRIINAFGSGQEMSPYQIEEAADGTTYIRYKAGDGKVAIRRITEEPSGGGTLTTIEVAYDTWANRDMATYEPINDANMEG